MSFQLKAQRKWNCSRITDGAYESMIKAIAGDRNPSLFVMQYSGDWTIANLMVVPNSFFSSSVIEVRSPLGPLARRAGWTGCNINLRLIPPPGRITIVESGRPIATSRVRRQFAQAQRLRSVSPSVRGWTLDVLRAVTKMNRDRFSLQDAYSFEEELKQLHPRNSNIRPKIRQQLQVLRDEGFVEFLGKGEYRLCRSGQ